jgi:hypothetical protein
MTDAPITFPDRPPVSELIDRLNALPAPPDIEVRDVEDLPEPEGL